MIKLFAISHPAFTSTNREIFRRLNNSDYQVTLVVPKTIRFPSGVKTPDPVSPNDPEILFLETKRTNPRVQIFINLIQHINAKKPDLVFFDNDPGSLQSVIIGRWCRKNHIPFVVQTCENIPFGLKSSFSRLGVKGLILSFLKLSLNKVNKKRIEHIFTINDDGTKIFKSLGYHSVSKIPLGFNEQLFTDFPEKREKIRSNLYLNRPVIAYFGRLVYEKGIHILLAALAKIKTLEWFLILDNFEQYKNDYSTTISQLIKDLALENKIKTIHASHTEIADFMNASDIVVLASISTPKWREQYGRVIPEAMATKNAVIVTKSGALPELIGDSGIIIEEQNIDALSNSLQQLIENPALLQDYKERAFQRAHAFLGIQTQLNHYTSVFKALVEKE